MTKEPRSASGPTSYGEVVERLQEVVEALEGGDLTLEESLLRFEEGVGLVKRGETLLGEAEKRIEQLLADDRAAPVDLTTAAPPNARPAPAARPAARKDRVPAPPALADDPGEDDVPF